AMDTTPSVPVNIAWIGNATQGHLRLLDQTLLPTRVEHIDCRDIQTVWRTIRSLAVRGAPAIGVAAAYACVLPVQKLADASEARRQAALNEAVDYLATSRPTAVNLFWALDQMRAVKPCTPDNLLKRALEIHDQDRAMCLAIGRHGLERFRKINPRRKPANLPQSLGVLTHCNAGALATGGVGTATAPIYLARQQNLPLAVYADETRPLLQGARLTAYELASAGVDVTLICDDMAGQVMREGRVDLIITGADRIAANGDAANKIGTYSLAVMARHHRIPFFVAAPSSTFDLSIPDGSAIPIEQRADTEITEGFGRRTAPADIKTYNPAFDVTPHDLITAIITERGVIEPVNAGAVAMLMSRD
ncbi:MAG: S-methyl-5-thioribose-1-phosphate isomerase, partial [Phycisphaeraceae bacterium]|nr:S-methyl-5-thioribose-1-phosphate isomerase [Phycisphaeraceae bacterium]